MFALQRLDAMPPAAAADSAVWQAPISPRLLVGAARPAKGPPPGMADLLARAGMDDPEIVAAMVRGWRQLIDAVRPNLVIADFAPFLLLATRGRLPTMAVGNGFTLPPAAMQAFPPLIESIPGVDQQEVLEQLNAGLADAGAPTIGALPAGLRRRPRHPRDLRRARSLRGAAAAKRGRCPIRSISMRWRAKARRSSSSPPSGSRPIRRSGAGWRWPACRCGSMCRAAAPPLREALTNLGIHFEPEPLPFAEIAKRSRLLVSHGGHGFVCAGLVAGLPQVVCHYDLEKLVYGLAVARAGMGGHAPLGGIDPEAFSASLKQVYHDEPLAARARAAAPGFRSRGQIPEARAVAEAVDRAGLSRSLRGGNNRSRRALCGAWIDFSPGSRATSPSFPGQPATFVVAFGLILVWAMTGPLFGYSDTWQLVINTSTTIVTFLMVFLIQNSTNRDAAAMQAKLDELLRAVAKARGEFIGIEHLTDKEIEKIRDGARGRGEGAARRQGHRDTGESADQALTDTLGIEPRADHRTHRESNQRVALQGGAPQRTRGFVCGVRERAGNDDGGRVERAKGIEPSS